MAEAEARQQRDRQEADVKYPARLAELAQQARRRPEAGRRALSAPDQGPGREVRAATHQQLQESYRKTKETTKQQYDQAWSNLIRTWTEGLARVGGVAGEVNEESARRFLDWHADRARPTGSRPREVPPALPFGKFTVDLSDFPSGCPPIPGSRTPGRRSSSCRPLSRSRSRPRC